MFSLPRHHTPHPKHITEGSWLWARSHGFEGSLRGYSSISENGMSSSGDTASPREFLI